MIKNAHFTHEITRSVNGGNFKRYTSQREDGIEDYRYVEVEDERPECLRVMAPWMKKKTLGGSYDDLGRIQNPTQLP